MKPVADGLLIVCNWRPAGLMQLLCHKYLEYNFS